MLFQITYHSFSRPGLSITEIEDIITQAKKFNSAHEISGCLIYNKGYFLQVLEGEKQLVTSLINSIKLDDRHDHFTILSEGETNERTFKEWSMAFYHDPLNTELNGEVQEIKDKLLALSASSEKSIFAMKVFWYNVRNLLTEKGYYKPG
ncbi:BLUF domain-containing protein [uncultured Eudoraea sp.]|uniref:BLUF domain-containing protein n=1 Tax=uncultured Eudoraea sp. TaxID=1035614 RepID=UPI00262DD195|nr:BLUF domain-containing protein [uncultured Eudoraea sp.]